MIDEGSSLARRPTFIHCVADIATSSITRDRMDRIAIQKPDGSESRPIYLQPSGRSLRILRNQRWGTSSCHTLGPYRSRKFGRTPASRKRSRFFTYIPSTSAPAGFMRRRFKSLSKLQLLLIAIPVSAVNAKSVCGPGVLAGSITDDQYAETPVLAWSTTLVRGEVRWTVA